MTTPAGLLPMPSDDQPPSPPTPPPGLPGASDPPAPAGPPPAETTPEGHDEASRPGEMTFLEHLEELRGTLLRCGAVLIVMAVGIGLFLRYFAELLNWPLRFAVGPDASALQGLVTTSPMGVFSVVLQVCFLGGFALALPFMLYFLARFIAPGLTPRELKVLRPGVLAAALLFLGGATFSFFILVPAALKASIYFNQLLGFELIWSADRYYGLLVWMVLGIGVAFEFPLVLVVMVWIGFANTAQLRAFRPYSVVLFLALAAVLTPTTDPFTFLLLAVPMSFLYEGALRVARVVERRKKAKA